MTVTGELSQAGINEKVTVPVSFDIPENTAELQVMAYDGAGTLNALAPSYTVDMNSLSLTAVYDGGEIGLRLDLGQYIGREALCLITDDADGGIVYIRQETVKDGTFKTIRTGELDGEYGINIGVAGEGIVISEKAYTAVNIDTDNPEESETLYSWDFSDESQTAESGSNIPVTGGNAVYDSETGSVKMTSSDSSGGTMGITFDEPVTFVQGEKITVVSKVAYGRQSGRYMDWSVTDSAGNELVSTHISVYSSSSSQSVKIGGEEKLGSGLPAGIATSKKNNNGYENGFTTYTAVFDPDIDTITLTASNDEGSTTFTGKFPEGTVYDIAELEFSTTQTYASRSCYVDDISVTRTTAPSYTMGFDVRNDANAVIGNAAVTVTDAVYGTVIAPESDGTYHLCDGVYSYAVTAEGYEPLTGELELSQSTLSKTVTVMLQRIGEPDPTPEASDSGSTISVTG